jgi:glycosyltransferase involved in cell wall biosynthesis
VSFEPRILFVDQTGKLGGAELCLADLAIHLRNRSRVFLFEGGPFQQLLEENGVDVRILKGAAPKPRVYKNSKLYAYLFAFPALIFLVVKVVRAAAGFDLLYANTAKALIATASAALLLRKPFVFHLHDMIDAAHFNQLNRWLLVSAANRATGIVANSQATAAAYKKAGGTNPNLAVVPNGFRIERFEADVTSLSQKVRVSTRSEDLPLVGLFGRITEWKGQRVLIQALSRLPDIKAVIVGEALFTEEDQQYKRDLVELAEQLGVSDRIQFVGFQADILPFLRAVDLVVHCSISPEPFGRVIVEALLAGKPVIATRSGGPAEIIEDEVTGILVNPGDSAELAQAIEELLRDRNWAARLASAGRDAMSIRFTLDRVLEEWTEFVNRCAPETVTKSGLKTSKSLPPGGAGEHEVKLTGA